MSLWDDLEIPLVAEIVDATRAAAVRMARVNLANEETTSLVQGSLQTTRTQMQTTSSGNDNSRLGWCETIGRNRSQRCSGPSNCISNGLDLAQFKPDRAISPRGADPLEA